MNTARLLEIPPYSLTGKERHHLLTEALSELTIHHYHNCQYYRMMLNSIGFNPYSETNTFHDLPFLPVPLFKILDLKSIPQEEVYRTLFSSGTSDALSKVYLDKTTALLQQKALIRVVSAFTGLRRMPMLVIDIPGVLKRQDSFNPRSVAVRGYSMFASEMCFALHSNMEINIDAIRNFFDNHRGKEIFLFGFTYIFWKFFHQALQAIDFRPDLSRAILIHGGGWKKLQEQSVSNGVFRETLRELYGLKRIYQYYGMVEQPGSIYLECSQGHLHTSILGGILIRRPVDLTVASPGETGLIQVLSVLPYSYCGHNLLTEDEGVLLGENDCPCGCSGSYFKVLGRKEKADIKGCSDAYPV
jgi:hypothetical protein